MNKKREALEKALLALEIAPLDHNSVKSSFFEKRHYAIIALREALAEPARKPLTDAEISAIVQSMSVYTWDAHMLARAIERAHGIGEE